MSFDKTSVLMWDLFTTQFGVEKDMIWYFDKSDVDNFKYALNYYLEKLWVIPMERSDEFPHDFESTAYVSNVHLNKFSRNSSELLNGFWREKTTIFETNNSSIDGAVNTKKNIFELKGQGDLGQSDFFICGGLDAVKVSVEFINRMILVPSVIDLSETPLEINRNNFTFISDHSKKIYERYKTKTAIIGNESIQKSAVNWLNSSTSSSQYSKIFFSNEEALDWVH